jgi:hypothetical protein
MIRLIYRISDVGYQKIKPPYINNESCLKNALIAFPKDKCDWLVIADSVSDGTKRLIEELVGADKIHHVNFKRGPGAPFIYAMDYLLPQVSDQDILYFVENDYLHRPGSHEILKEGFELGADYVSLYDHPDKYFDGVNPYVEQGGEVTKVFLTKNCHWKFTNSTTGTFALLGKTLKSDYSILKKYAEKPSWSDFYMFIELGQMGKSLVTPIPSFSTHGETNWLAPLINWEKYATSNT